jgi:phosphoadenosine phosphosulfate reductase
MDSISLQNIINFLSSDNTSIIEGLSYIDNQSLGKIKFSTSFGYEDQIITHLISNNELSNIEIFTLDTGRLFQETYSVWSSTLDRYKNIKIQGYYPDAQKLSAFVTNNGINAFYESIDLRKSCCGIRKVEPLKRALEGVDIWVTGLRGDSENGRSDIPVVTWDETFNLIKYNPLINWTVNDVKDYIKKYNIPYNPLHDKGFASIGCAPCTRAIRADEKERAGRWWWENTEARECGLHVATIIQS